MDWVEALHLAGQVRTRRNTVANVAKELGVKQKKIHAYASDSLNIEDIYEVGEMLGSGVAGEVHSAMHRETGTACCRAERAHPRPRAACTRISAI